MGNRVTKDEFNRLRKKKRRYNAIVSFVSATSLIAVLAICIVVFSKRPTNREYSEKMNFNASEESLFNNLDNMYQTDTDAASENPSDDNTGEGTASNGDADLDGPYYVSFSESDEQEFIIPETELPPVEQLEGNDWCPSDYIKINEVAPLSYFDNSVLIGDSRTEGLVVYTGLSNLNGFCYRGLNVGILDTEQCITLSEYGGKYTCYQAISLTHFDNYYCMFGINELGWYNLDIFIEDFSALVDHIKKENPDAMVYVEGVIPVSRSKEAESTVFTRAKVEEFNRLLLEMCQSRNDVVFLDVGAAVRDEDGYLPEEGTPDGIHCNADYCKRVLQYIRCNTYRKK